MTYLGRLESVKANYPFDKWRAMSFPNEDGEEGLEQYTEENCNAAKGHLDKLIHELHAIGEQAPVEKKL